MLAHHGQGAVQVRRGLLMDRNHIGAGGGESLDVSLRIFDHEMHVEGQAGCLAKRCYYRDADGNIGHKMAVHDVHVKGGNSALFHRTNGVTQTSEIRG